MRDFIDSGLLETYVIGAASEQEAQEVITMAQKYPEVRLALSQIELDMEHMAQAMAIAPPPTSWSRIEEEISGLIIAPETTIEVFKTREYKETPPPPPGEQYIEVEAQSKFMKVHKAWKGIFIAVFILGKIFLACAIYFYLENKHAQESIQELKLEVKELKGR